MLIQVALCLLLPVFIQAKNTYMITAPNRVTPGQPYQVNVNILNATEPVSVTASILRKWYNNSQFVKEKIVSLESRFEQGLPGIITLILPEGTVSTGNFLLKVEGTGGLVFEREDNVFLPVKTLSIFIQTDKAIYKPGQRVHFRVFAVHPNLRVYDGPFEVEIIDPKDNKIRHYMNIKDPSAVAERDLLLSDQPNLGTWTINVKISQSSQSIRGHKTFTVQQYELPKFEIKVDLPSFELTTNEELTGKVHANYTYGEGVKGMVQLRVYVGAIRNYCGALARSVQKAFPIDGTAEFSVPVSEIKKLQSYLIQQTITVVADVTEELTGKTLNGTSTVTYYDQPYKIEFLKSSPNTFKPGLPYRAYIKVTQQDGRPVSDVSAGVQVYTCVDYERTVDNQSKYDCSSFTGTYALPVKMLILPEDGVIPVDVDIPDNTTNVRMRAYYKNVHGSLSISKSQSPSDTYVQATLQTLDLKAGMTGTVDILATTPPGIVSYRISSRGRLVISGHIPVQSDPATNKRSLQFEVLPTMSPTATLLVYFVKDSGEVVADSISFNVDGIFENEVSLGFSREEAKPHSDVTVQVNADVNSQVYLLAVDQSVLLLKSGNGITTDSVMDELRSYDPSSPSPEFATWRYPVPSSGINAQQIFQRANVLVLTDALLYSRTRQSSYNRHQKYRTNFEGHYGSPGARGMPDAMMSYDELGRAPSPHVASSAPSTLNVKKVERTREIFPETWLWTNSTVSSDGSVSLPLEVPDTITSWVASVFAINSQSGLGVSPTTAKLKVFRSFFVSLNMPLSVVRGEQVIIQANVFNYMESDQEVYVTLKSNAKFESIVIGPSNKESMTSEPQTQKVNVLPGKAKSVFFPIVPKDIGSVEVEVAAQSPGAADAVKRQLTVKAEGVRKEKNIPIIVDLTTDGSFKQSMKINRPAGLVRGSERIRLSVTGDLLGPTIDGIEDLLALPTGCGEQNMLKFAPNIYIADYLMATKQMTENLENRIKTYLEIGYQRQLSYQRSDGSFSTFGERDEAGSVWLTSFVVKSFLRAANYIYVDKETVDKAVAWLERKQLKDGSFREPGKIIDRKLQGYHGNSPSLTAYVLLSMLELEAEGHNGTRVNASKLAKARAMTTDYLSGLDVNSLETYPLSISAYALRKAGSKASAKFFSQLKKRWTNKGIYRYWDAVADKKTKKMVVESLDIITTSYGLLTFVERGKSNPGLPIMRWLTKQRTPRGGFLSSADTNIALEALTAFLRSVQPNNYNMKIRLTAGEVTETLTINNENVLVLQSMDVPSIPKELTITATGEGMAIVELGWFYNVISNDDSNEVFDVSTVLLDDTINGFTLMTCSKHLYGGSSGMCVNRIQIPSGFTPDLSSAGNIAGLKRLEQQGQEVVVYYDEIGKSSTCLTLSCSRTDKVAKSKPAFVTMTEYYNPNDVTIANYHPRQLKSSSICDLCRECAGCTNQKK